MDSTGHTRHRFYTLGLLALVAFCGYVLTGLSRKLSFHRIKHLRRARSVLGNAGGGGLQLAPSYATSLHDHRSHLVVKYESNVLIAYTHYRRYGA